ERTDAESDDHGDGRGLGFDRMFTKVSAPTGDKKTFVVFSLGAYFQGWCPEMERGNVFVNLERFEGSAYRGYRGLDDLARSIGLGYAQQVNGTEPRYLDLLRGDDEFINMLEEVFEKVQFSFKQMEEVLVLVWCKRGKHRSVAMAELLAELVASRVPVVTVKKWHLEQARWDIVTRQAWKMDPNHSVPFVTARDR
ncbi:MAG: hypothetical protein GY708_23080, partial [Actinomycetia bacterium]|nr:hypothetical protein [Actinomycetes bacterium]